MEHQKTKQMTELSLSKKRNKEETIMPEKQKPIHNAYCDYEVEKASRPSRIYSVRTETRKPHGIKTDNMSKAMLARKLASLF